MKPTVSFHTLGCKLNFAETSAIGRQLKEAGFVKTDFDTGADVVVINTCSVTENADRECRSIVRKALNINPDSFITVIGCYAQLKPEVISEIEGVDLVLGAGEKFNLAEYIHDFTKKSKAEIHSCTIGEVNIFNPSYSSDDRTRTFLKVQDGCNYPCTYCTIPLARGNSRSATIEQVLQQAREIAQNGTKEIVLTGVNIGDFGIYDGFESKHESTFLELITELDKIEGIDRFRISSIEPNLLSDDIISFVANSKKFAPHFHIPLQSGSNRILGLMKRRYRRELYSQRVKMIKSLMPHACIGADVIVGFPGETEKEFIETYDFINGLDISYLHVFTYSERDHTEAIELPGKVDMSIRKRRNKMLRILSEKKRQAFYRENIGTVRTVIFENESHDGKMQGYTENYIRVSSAFDSSLTNIPLNIILESCDGSACMNASFELVTA